MPDRQYTRRDLISEDADLRVYEVEGTDGDGDPFVGVEVEPKTTPPGDVLRARIEQLIPELRDGLRTFAADNLATKLQTIFIGLRVVLALARLQVSQLDDDE